MDPIILDLNLKRQWFDMYLSGIKKEDYRDIKPHWEKILIMNRMIIPIEFIHFTHVRFSNGYNPWPFRPHFIAECLPIKIGVGNKEWGASGQNQFIIPIGKIIEKLNC